MTALGRGKAAAIYPWLEGVSAEPSCLTPDEVSRLAQACLGLASQLDRERTRALALDASITAQTSAEVPRAGEFAHAVEQMRAAIERAGARK